MMQRILKFDSKLQGHSASLEEMEVNNSSYLALIGGIPLGTDTKAHLQDRG